MGLGAIASLPPCAVFCKGCAGCTGFEDAVQDLPSCSCSNALLLSNQKYNLIELTVKIFLNFENYMASRACQKNSAASLDKIREKLVSIWLTFQCSDMKNNMQKKQKHIIYGSLQQNIEANRQTKVNQRMPYLTNSFSLFNYFSENVNFLCLLHSH